ncbi:MAG: glycosyltransferase [Mycobacterium sp.]|uniref:glycosyltransferase n=1 Tax=Mycobacterium sp. TaxID=1785 RepID=UPI003CC540D2
MKFVLAVYGSRGDVEPGAAVGVELLRRGHDVAMAVPPDMLGFVGTAGLAAVAYGPDAQGLLHDENFIGNLSNKMQNPLSILPEVIEHANRVCADKSATLTALAEGADLLVAGVAEQGIAANVAEFHGIPSAALHLFPARVWSSGGLYSQITKSAEDAQRRILGLPEATDSSTAPTTDRGWLEIQAFEEFCLPKLAVGWVEHNDQHPFTGALTLDLPTDADDEVLSWIAAGPPPIYFGFGSTPVAAFADAVTTISAASAQLGERALICSGPNDFDNVPQSEHVKIIDSVSHAAVFPACRAVVHHGGSGTTAAGLRAGVPMLILWLWLDQPMWAACAEELEVGVGRGFSQSGQESLVSDLRVILAPEYLARAREVAIRMTPPAKSVAAAADLLEDAARAGRPA